MEWELSRETCFIEHLYINLVIGINIQYSSRQPAIFDFQLDNRIKDKLPISIFKSVGNRINTKIGNHKGQSFSNTSETGLFLEEGQGADLFKVDCERSSYKNCISCISFSISCY